MHSSEELIRVNLADIQQAHQRLLPVIRPTELDRSLTASKLLGLEVFLKLENMQYTGSFKFRGAYNKISRLTDEQKALGVIASSAGNHAQGVARAATLQGVRSKIIMPVGASLVKSEATKNYGAEVIFHGQTVDEAIEFARDLVAKESWTFVHPYEDPDIIAGQGTIGLEIAAAVQDWDSVIVPIGGGGLISGIATAMKALYPQCRVIGVVSEKADGMWRLKYAHPSVTLASSQAQGGMGKPSILPHAPTIADGIAVKRPSHRMFRSFIEPLVDDIVSVSDDEIAEAMVFLMERMKVVAEGSGAAALAAALHRPLKLGRKTCIVISGGNVDLNWIEKVIQKAQVRGGRVAEITVSIIDLPGQLSQITQVISEQGANILDVRHDRVKPQLLLRETHIHFLLETKNHDHIAAIKKALVDRGFCVL